MTAVIETEGLGKRYRTRWALAGCTLAIPAGHVVGLVGPNGAGKTTLINLATGMLAPSAGTIEVLGGPPIAGPAQLARVRYLAQDAPLYAGLPVAGRRSVPSPGLRLARQQRNRQAAHNPDPDHRAEADAHRVPLA
jgi:ABC-2 type transport system ATP-binding protein